MKSFRWKLAPKPGKWKFKSQIAFEIHFRANAVAAVLDTIHKHIFSRFPFHDKAKRNNEKC